MPDGKESVVTSEESEPKRPFSTRMRISVERCLANHLPAQVVLGTVPLTGRSSQMNDIARRETAMDTRRPGAL